MGINTEEVLRLVNQKKKKKQAEEIARLFVEKRAQQNVPTSVTNAVPDTEAVAVHTTETKAQDRFFKAGAFSDGYQFGDVIKTILGTTGDVTVNAVKGAGSLVEGVTDLLGYAGAGIADLVGADKLASDWKKSVQKNTVDAILKGAEDRVDKYSVLGDRSDAIAQGLGQVAAILLTGGAAGADWLGSAGATALTTAVTGLSGMGSGMSQAYQEGATDGEAVAYGTIAGTAEALTELIFAGMGKSIKALGFSKGLSSADDILAKKLSSKISSQLGKNLVELGVKAGAEGSEEVLSGIAQAFGKKLTYKSEEEIGKLIKDERLFDQFLTGAITSGIAQSGIVPGMKRGSFREATEAGRDMITGLTKNEQKVVDKLYADQVAEREKSGALSKKQKAELYDKVLEDIESGRVSTDTIESILGGDTYKGYQETLAKESKLKKEIEELEGLADNAITVKQRERLTEARKELEGLDTKTAKSNLFNHVDKLTANDIKLRESYNERTRRGQAFTADLTKYDEKMRPTIQRAINNGEINNTRATHAFVEGLAKIEAEKGIGFDFTNNERLEELGLTVAGRNVGGYVSGTNITLNLSSAEALNKVVGHEVTHVFEGTEQYETLAAAMKEFAAEKGIDWNARVQEMQERYQNVKNADPEKELLADLVGEYLFTDSGFVKSLSTKNPGLFKKIFEEIKYLAKTFAGTKQGAALEKVKNTFAEMYRDVDVKNTAQTDGVKYSLLVKDVKGNTTAVNPAETTPEQIRDYMVKSRKGQLEQYTYFPVSSHTSKTVISILKNADIDIADKPLAMQAKKARQSQNDGQHIERDGTVVRHHALTPDEIVEAIEKLDDPIAAIHQQDRVKKEVEDGKTIYVPAPDNFVFFVTLDNGKECAVVIEFDSFIKKESIQKDGLGDDYHTTVTVFEPDQFRDGEEFDYIEYLAVQPSNRELEIKKESPETETAISQTQATVSEKELSNDSIRNPDEKVNGKFSLSETEGTAPVGDYRITGEDIALTPTKEDNARMEQGIATAPAALRNDIEELGAPTREDIARIERDKKLKGPLLMKDSLDRELEKLYRLQQLNQIQDNAYFVELFKVNAAYQAAGRDFTEAFNRVVGAYQGEAVNGAAAILKDVSDVKQKEVEAVIGEKDAYVSKQANALYDEVKSMQKGKRVSNTLSYLLDTLDLSEEHKAESYGSLRTALLNIRDNPNQVVNSNSAVEAAAREMLGREYDAMAEDFANAEGVAKSIYTKMESLRRELENNQSLREQSNADFDSELARLQAEYEGKKNKNTKAANDLLRRIERTQRLKSQVDADYGKRIDRIGQQLERISRPEYKTAMQRKAKMEEYTNRMAELVGDTSTWVDKKLGLSYSVNTLRRNLRDIVRDSKGNRDIAKADAIYEELQGNYNHNEAELKRESMRLKEVFQDLKLNHAEDTYAHMLGEFQYNPDSKLSQERLEEFYEKHKDKIDTQKVDKAIEEARKVFDDLIVRVNERLKEQGMRQIPYRKGYFPHFTNPKQTWLHKFFNWKPVDNEIPTSIAGLTEEFNPQRSWQSFDKQRVSDDTDYSLAQGLDSYIHGALDWIYHIEDIQKRRALENHIRYIHSDEGIKQRIEEIKNNESYDMDEAQQHIDAVYAEAKNPLNNFVTDLRTGTNTLANKKSSLDRKAEEMTNRKIYSVMTNLNSRINANMVVGSFSSALTNFIPITQSWMEVSPLYSLKGMRDTIKSTIREDGMVNKSDFLTNRLKNEEKLYQTGWDKVSEKAGFLMEVIDSFTSQTVWRSKYLQNMAEGMSEVEAIKNADQFAENVIAGRSRGNQPTIFDAKNPITKIFTAFQLEVANQYGYMFKDAPQDSKNQKRLVMGYAKAFLGAYAYNALYSSLVGRDAAFDPLSILEDLFRDLFGDDEEEPEEAILNLADNVLEEVPFIGGLIGGGRIPLSSAIPYEGDYTTFITDLANGELSAKEMLKPIYYLAMPVAGGQLKKTNEGLKMFDEDLPVAGSYTESGNLRFPVEDDSIADWLQAALFGQYASKNAREYFDNGWAPLKENQIEEFVSLDIPIADYREIRKQLGKLETTADKFDYVDSLDLTVEQKNILVNNIVDRKEPVDMTDYQMYEDFDEFDFYIKNQEKYQFLKDNGIAYKTYNASEESREAYSWAFQNPEKYQVSRAVTEDTVTYKSYTKALSQIKADKDSKGNTVSGSRKKKVVQYINGLDAEYGAKLVLYKTEYPSDNSYNGKIIEYVNSIEGFTYGQKEAVLKELGFKVDTQGRISW